MGEELKRCVAWFVVKPSGNVAIQSCCDADVIGSFRVFERRSCWSGWPSVALLHLARIARRGNVAIFFLQLQRTPGSQAQFKLISSFNLHFSHKLIEIRSILCRAPILFLYYTSEVGEKQFFFSGTTRRQIISKTGTSFSVCVRDGLAQKLRFFACRDIYPIIWVPFTNIACPLQFSSFAPGFFFYGL